MTISFQLDLNGKSRSFYLNRGTSDPLSSSLERIRLNLQKCSTKIKRKGLKGSDKQPDEIPAPSKVELTLQGRYLDPETTRNIDAWVEGATLVLNNISYEVRTNDPQVDSMKLPSCIMSGFYLMPTVSLVNGRLDDCKFTWYRQISPKERGISTDNLQFDGQHYWVKIADKMIYLTTPEDIAHHLKVVCRPSDGIKEGPEQFCVSLAPVEIRPLKCPFELRAQHTKERLFQPNQFRFMTYNILADLYADSDYSRSVLFAHCPSYALDIDYRRQLLLKEISCYNADLICLQEVDKKEYLRNYETFFTYFGNYSGVYDTKGGNVGEGLATIYSNDKFELIDSHRTLLADLIEQRDRNEKSSLEASHGNTLVEDKPLVGITPRQHPVLENRHSPEAKQCLARFDTIRQAITRGPEVKKRFLDRHTVLQTTLLRLRESADRFVVVANTHLYFAPDADHVRLLQGSVCVKYIEFIKDFYSEKLCTNHAKPQIGVVFCGDMNSSPDCGLYKLLTQGKVTHESPDWSSNEEEAVIGLDIETALRFSSAYENIEYTNYTPEFKGCLDYIYYERDKISCASVVPLPDHEDVAATGGIPSDVFPSDHLALVANLEFSSKP